VLTKNEILITDSCILFDLLDLSLIQAFFQISNKIYTTPQVIEEITNSFQMSEINKYISKGNLIINTDGSFESIQDLFDELQGLSYTDCSILELASRKNGVVVSSDKTLRNESIRRKQNVKGMLWLIEVFVEKGYITKEIALEKLNIYPDLNKRAPIQEIIKLSAKFES